MLFRSEGRRGKRQRDCGHSKHVRETCREAGPILAPLEPRVQPAGERWCINPSSVNTEVIGWCVFLQDVGAFELGMGHMARVLSLEVGARHMSWPPKGPWLFHLLSLMFSAYKVVDHTVSVAVSATCAEIQAAFDRSGYQLEPRREGGGGGPADGFQTRCHARDVLFDVSVPFPCTNAYVFVWCR
jgi:hypothetical protein